MAKRKATKKKSTAVAKSGRKLSQRSGDPLLGDLRNLIDESRRHVVQTVNSALVWLYWHIGKRIREDVLQDQRAGYGEEIVSTLSKELSAEYGKGYSAPNLSRMVRFAEHFPHENIVSALSTQLSWSHFVELLSLQDSLKCDFYAEMCRLERWSTRTLRQQIDRMLFERTAVSKRPDEVIAQELSALRNDDRLTPELVFRDPYFLGFLGLADQYAEKDLEQAILRELETFILELGTDFAFVARQKRITVDNEDDYLDLLFYHRRLRRLVAIDPKLGRFQAADKGQMELYLRWLEKYDVQAGEKSPFGLVLCADKSEEHVELLRLEESGIRVAAYLTELPPRELLVRKLRDATRLARERLIAAGRNGALRESKKTSAGKRSSPPRREKSRR